MKNDENLEQCQSELAESYADVPNNECSFRESLCDAVTYTEAGNNLKTYRNNQLGSEAQSECDTDKNSIDETSNSPVVNADHEDSLSSFRNSTSITNGFNEVLWKIQLIGDSALMIMADLFLNERNFDWKEFLKTDIK